jgi:hypothetical protein
MMRPLVVCVMTHDGEIRQLPRALRSKGHLVEIALEGSAPATRRCAAGRRRDRPPGKLWREVKAQRYLLAFFHSVSSSRMSFQSTAFTSGT